MIPMTPDDLRAAFAELPPVSPVAPVHSWQYWTYDLRQQIASQDPARFLTWPTVVATMFVGNAPYIQAELDTLPLEYIAKLSEPRIGDPAIFQSGNLSTSGNLIHQFYHAWQLEKCSARWIPEMDTIVEVGGGYGAMALVCHRLGFRGRYIILDLPEFSLLQQYYLSNCGASGVEFVTQLDGEIEADLLIGIHSLNEMTIAERDTITALCPARSYLMAYGAAWGGWDNMAWATAFMKRKEAHNWRNWNIPHLPNCWYLVGDERT